MSWTGSIVSADHDSTGHLLVSAVLVSNDGAQISISRAIAAGTVGTSKELTELINEWVQSETDKLNKFDGIVQPALAELAKTNPALVAKIIEVKI